MSNVWGTSIKLTIFGESHGPAIGAVIGGLPPGEAIDMDEIHAQMARRAPGGALSTARREADQVTVMSGLKDFVTTGAPVCGIIQNADARSRDYRLDLPRPGHADWTAHVKYNGFADMRGGGHFSGRLTAPLVFAGAIARQILSRRGITVGARITQIGAERDGSPFTPSPEAFASVAAKEFPASDGESAERMIKCITDAKADGDSVGGVVEGVLLGLPAGLGEPFFDSMESVISSMLFSIPAVKGVEFGGGFNICALRGSEANDQMEYDGGVRMLSNHSGGILGGITSGIPLVVRAAFKPTPSIAKEQRTVNLETMENAALTIAGRHDPCVVPRAVPVVEAALALCALDMMITGKLL